MGAADKPGYVARAIDAVVAAMSPERALRRTQARARLQSVSSPDVRSAVRDRNVAALRFEAARFDRLRAKMSSGSADGDLLQDLDALRQKSQALVRDDPYASAAIRVSVENVVGTGIMPQATVRPEETGCTESQCSDFNRAAEQYFREWAENWCDANRISDFADMTNIVYRGKLVDGESIAHRVLLAGRGGADQTAFELIDPARLQDPFSSTSNTRHGVEIGEAGQPVAYWITPYHPDDVRFLRTGAIGANTPVRIERFRGGYWNVLHCYRRQRAGQSRGIPVLVASLGMVDHLHHYLDSELIGARVQSNNAGVIERPLDQTDPSIELGDTREGTGELIFHESSDPGTFVYLNPGEKYTPSPVVRPGNTFDAFVIRILRAIAGSTGLSYEMVAKDFSSMNYSSSRSMLLEARRGFESEQMMLIRTWCRPAYQTVIREGIHRGDLPNFAQMLGRMEAFLKARWIRPAWGWVDPVKEIESSTMAVEGNLSTPQAEAARSGMDLEEVYEARADAWVLARDVERRKGLPEGALQAQSSKQPPPPPQESDEEQDEEPAQESTR